MHAPVHDKHLSKVLNIHKRAFYRKLLIKKMVEILRDIEPFINNELRFRSIQSIVFKPFNVFKGILTTINISIHLI